MTEFCERKSDVTWEQLFILFSALQRKSEHQRKLSSDKFKINKADF